MTTSVISSHGYINVPEVGMVEVKRAFANIAANSTDAAFITAVTGKRIAVLYHALTSATGSTPVTFNSKGSGAGTAISPLFNSPLSNVAHSPYIPDAHFKTTSGEGLTVTTGAGGVTGVIVLYIEV